MLGHAHGLLMAIDKRSVLPHVLSFMCGNVLWKVVLVGGFVVGRETGAGNVILAHVRPGVSVL